MMERGDRPIDHLLVLTRRFPELRAGQGSELADRGDDRVVVGRLAVRRDEQRYETWRNTGDDASEVLADTDETLLRELVLRRPEKAHRFAPRDELAIIVADRPVLLGAPVDLLPKRRENDVGLREEEREADAIDPGGCCG